MEKLKSIDKERTETICVIDGIRFEAPKNFEEYLMIGVIGLVLLVTLPLWIWAYLSAKIFQGISTKKKIKVKYRQLICPVCGVPTIKGDYRKMICQTCGWYEYTND
jgi:hypothetical protein